MSKPNLFTQIVERDYLTNYVGDAVWKKATINCLRNYHKRVVRLIQRQPRHGFDDVIFPQRLLDELEDLKRGKL